MKVVFFYASGRKRVQIVTEAFSDDSFGSLFDSDFVRERLLDKGCVLECVAFSILVDDGCRLPLPSNETSIGNLKQLQGYEESDPLIVDVRPRDTTTYRVCRDCDRRQ
jgi:hypothetical protein